MLDLGANVTVNPSNLLQFALMGFCYFSIMPKADVCLLLIKLRRMRCLQKPKTLLILSISSRHEIL